MSHYYNAVNVGIVLVRAAIEGLSDGHISALAPSGRHLKNI